MDILPATSVENTIADLSGDLTPAEKIARIESEMRLSADQIEIPVRHIFSKGIYAREITIPKNATLVGKTHRFQNLNIISKGVISVMTESGVQTLHAPCTIVSPPGTKRVGFAHEETVWTTIHATEETDLDRLEAEMIVGSHEDVGLPLDELMKIGG